LIKIRIDTDKRHQSSLLHKFTFCSVVVDEDTSKHYGTKIRKRSLR